MNAEENNATIRIVSTAPSTFGLLKSRYFYLENLLSGLRTFFKEQPV